MATIKDVARIAGVSVSTVSHVVNGTRYVSPEKVRKVEDAIRQLDELPNFIAKRSALKSKLSESRYVLILLSKKRSLFQNQVKEKLEGIVISPFRWRMTSMKTDWRPSAHWQERWILREWSLSRTGKVCFPKPFQRVPVSGGSDWEPRGSVCRRHPAARHL